MRAGLRIAAIAGLVWLSAVGPGVTQERAAPRSRPEVQLSFAPVVKKAAPAVVNIVNRRRQVATPFRSPLLDDPFFRRFFGDQLEDQSQPASVGSGVIVQPDGLIVSNNHVIANAEEIIVVLADRREFPAKVVIADERTDLAVLRIDPGNERLPVIELMNSDELEVGDLVLAIGNPFGVGQTVTSGIVSALARTRLGITDYQFFIQTDASINPGNSGGALVTMDGRLAGVNTAIFTQSGGSVGIGFAIPANMVASVINAALHGGRIARPWLGAAAQPVTAEIASSLGLARPAGALLRTVVPGSPADRAGLKVGDVVVALDGRPVDDPEALNYYVALKPIGQRATLGVRRGGRVTEVAVDLASPPEVPPRNVTDIGGQNPLTGARVANLSPALADELGLDPVASAQGVIILGIARGSPAQRVRLRPGDIILQVNRSGIDTVEDLQRALGAASEWRIRFRRGGQELNLVARG
ncbi:MAG: DegQ family serine endoprotease [Alphaproteobacteria bacterium]|nr:DegQ family serine endoprotease [Alphaproteobacteria bacterium]